MQMMIIRLQIEVFQYLKYLLFGVSFIIIFFSKVVKKMGQL